LAIHPPAELPIASLAAGTPFWRIHRSERAPIFFGPAPGKTPTNRFDPPNGEYRTLDLGLTFAAAFVETLLRQPQVTLIAASELETRSMSELTTKNDLNLVDLRGPGLSRIGADNALSTGPYETAGAWALALWAHSSNPDGILYRTRHDPAHVAAVIFNRPRTRFAVVETRPLIALSHRIGAVLNAHGKGIA
jgi:hypothetical protein